MPDSTPDVDDNGWVRVTDRDTGHKLSLRASQVAHGNYTVLKAEASDPLTGDPLPPEYAGAATVPAKKSASKKAAAKKTTPAKTATSTTGGQEADTSKEKSDG